MTAKTNAQKQADYRARLAAKGLTEVRGAYLPDDMHPELKKIAKSWLVIKPAKTKQEKRK